MTIEFIGYVAPTLQSEIIPAATPLDPAHVDKAAKIHEDAGFDRALVAFGSRYFHVQQAFSAKKSPQAPHIPICFGGASDAAIRVAGKHADVYALWGETHAQVADLVGRVRAEAARHGRTIRFSLSLRPILAETEAKAWARADDILQRARALAEKRDGLRKGEPENTGSRRGRLSRPERHPAAAISQQPSGNIPPYESGV